MEHRAALTGLAGSPSQPQGFRPYVFPQSVAQFMGWDLPIVAYGTPASRLSPHPSPCTEPAEGADAYRDHGSHWGGCPDTPAVSRAACGTPARMQPASPCLGDAVRGHVSAAYASAVDQRCLTDTTAGLLSITEPTDPAHRPTSMITWGPSWAGWASTLGVRQTFEC